MKKNAIFFSNRAFNHIDRVFIAEMKDRLHSMVHLHDVVIDRGNLKEYADVLKRVEIAFATWGMEAFTEYEIKEYMPSLKVLFYAAGSVQGFAMPFLNHQVTVVSAAAANGKSVAEYTLAQILLANKGFYQGQALAKRDYQASQKYFSAFPGNFNVKVGLIGIGMIGAQVAQLLKSFDIDVLAFDPFLSEDRAVELGLRVASLEEIFSTCQTISNHLSNHPETVGILSKEYFRVMGQTATFINTGRGKQVVEEDLAEALRAVPTRTAVLDVTVNEPLSLESPLMQLDNVILTPHIAGSSGNEVVRMAVYIVEELGRYIEGQPLKYCITRKMLETMA